MTDREAIEMFKAGIAAADCNVKKDLYKTAIAALEKRIPKKARRNDYWIPFCECGSKLNSYEKYCDYCGQRLDWGNRR